jgi:hypothetical protein
MTTIVKITKRAPRAASNVKPQGAASRPASLAIVCGKAAEALKLAARAEAAGRDELRRLMAGIATTAASVKMSRVDAGKVLAAALGLPNMARTVKGADGKHTAAASWVVSLVNAWQYAATALESRKADKAPKTPGAGKTGEGEGETDGETGEPTKAQETVITTATQLMSALLGFKAKHAKEYATAIEMICAVEGLVKYVAPKAKLAAVA